MTLSPEVLSGLRERLEPCPFCGGAVELTSSKTLGDRLFCIKCPDDSPCVGSGLGIYVVAGQVGVFAVGMAVKKRMPPRIGWTLIGSKPILFPSAAQASLARSCRERCIGIPPLRYMSGSGFIAASNSAKSASVISNATRSIFHPLIRSGVPGCGVLRMGMTLRPAEFAVNVFFQLT